MYTVRYLLKPQSLARLLKATASRERGRLKVTEAQRVLVTPPVPHLARAVKGHVPAISDTASTSPPFDPNDL